MAILEVHSCKSQSVASSARTALDFFFFLSSVK